MEIEAVTTSYLPRYPLRCARRATYLPRTCGGSKRTCNNLREMDVDEALLFDACEQRLYDVAVSH